MLGFFNLLDVLHEYACVGFSCALCTSLDRWACPRWRGFGLSSRREEGAYRGIGNRRTTPKTGQIPPALRVDGGTRLSAVLLLGHRFPICSLVAPNRQGGWRSRRGYVHLSNEAQSGRRFRCLVTRTYAQSGLYNTFNNTRNAVTRMLARESGNIIVHPSLIS